MGLLASAALLGLTSGSTAAAPHPSYASVKGLTVGELALRATLSVRSEPAACPAGTPPDADECRSRRGTGVVTGLGTVSEAYTFIVANPPSCADGDILLASDGRFTVAGKGEINLALSGLPDCFSPAITVLTAKRPFTVTGGSGKYVGASGSGTLQHALTASASGAAGKDFWVGTLVVPGLDFDVTAPRLSGAAAKSVRAPLGKKRARVVYRVTARDNVDGAVPATCLPRSGSLFKIGRTIVGCSAADTSGNTTRARFTVTVRPRRKGCAALRCHEACRGGSRFQHRGRVAFRPPPNHAPRQPLRTHVRGRASPGQPKPARQDSRGPQCVETSSSTSRRQFSRPARLPGAAAVRQPCPARSSSQRRRLRAQRRTRAPPSSPVECGGCARARTVHA
jgi:hypothetical protein